MFKKIILFLVVLVALANAYQYNATDKTLKYFLDDYLTNHLGLQYTANPAILSTTYPVNIAPQSITKDNGINILRAVLQPAGLIVYRSSGGVYVVDHISGHYQNIIQKSAVIELKNVDSSAVSGLSKMCLDSCKINYLDYNIISFLGSNSDYNHISNLIKNIDIIKPQYRAEVVIIEQTSSKLKESGFFEDGLKLQFNNNLSNGFAVNGSDFINVLGKFNTTDITFNVVSRPNFILSDRKKSDFFIGSDVPYTRVVSNGSSVQSEIYFKSIGLSVAVTPIFRDSVIDVTINQGYQSITATDGSMSSQKLSTILTATPNTGILIAGLSRDQTDTKISGIPFLMDIPILEKIFKYEKSYSINKKYYIYFYVEKMR
jgi:type II secretory pathway component GspD/PulD (secretin)